MASLGELLVSIGADISGFETGMQQVSARLSTVEKDAQHSLAGIENLGSQLTSVGIGMTAAVTAPLIGLGTAAVITAGQFEQAKMAFTNMLGSGEAATRMLEQLRDFSMKTPFEFPGLVDATRKLMAYQFSAQEIIPTLEAIGNAVSAMGGSAEVLNRVITAIGQMRAKTVVSAEEMRQLTEAGINAWQMLADKIGVTVPQAMKMAEQRMITSAVAIPAILEGMNAKFGGMMEQQSQTLLGKWSNFKDKITATLTDVGNELLPIASKLLDSFMPILDTVANMAKAFGELPQPVQTTILAAAALSAAIGPLLIGLGSMATGLVSIITLHKTLGPVLDLASGGITKVASSITGSLVPGAAAGTTALVALQAAAAATAVAIAAVAVYKIGEATYKLIEAHKEGEKAASGYEAQLQKFYNYLASQGVVVERGSDSLEKWQQRLSAAGMELGKTKKVTDDTSKSQNSMADILAKLNAKTKEATSAQQDHYKALRQLSPEMSVQVAMLQKQEQERQKLVQDIAAYRLGLQQEGGATVDLTADLEKLTDELYNSANANKALIATVPGVTTVLGNVSIPVDNYYEALNRAGIKSRETYEQMAADAGALWETIANDPRAGQWEKDNAFLRMLKAQADAMRANGTEIPAEMAAMMDSLEATVGGRKDKLTQPWKDMTAEIDRSITDLSTSIVQSLFEGDFSFADKAKKALRGIGEAVVTHFVTPATKAISDFISGAIADLLSGKGLGGVKDRVDEIGTAFKTIFGSGSSTASGAAGAAGAAGNVGGAGAGAGGAGGVLSSAGGLVGTLDMVGSLGSMVSGIISNFQNAKQETTLNAIEKSTRYAEIALAEGEDCISENLKTIRNMLWDFLRDGPGMATLGGLLVGISDAVVWGATQGTAQVWLNIEAGVAAVSAGVQRMADSLAVPAMTTAAVPAGGGFVVTVSGNTFYGMSADEVANAILKKIQESGGTL